MLLEEFTIELMQALQLRILEVEFGADYVIRWGCWLFMYFVHGYAGDTKFDRDVVHNLIKVKCGAVLIQSCHVSGRCQKVYLLAPEGQSKWLSSVLIVFTST